MAITQLFAPISNEHVIDVYPRPDNNQVSGWQRRLNLFPGRSLSDSALETEQTYRSGRLATLGQLLSPGVVNGLTVALTPEGILQIDPGRGITASGEDVILPQVIQIPVGEIPLQAPSRLLSGELTATDIRDGFEAVREVSNLSLADLADLSPEVQQAPPQASILEGLPRAGILVLEPIVLDIRGEFDPDTPCEEDPQNFAFEDWQWVDGCRLLLYTWPTEALEIPDRLANPATWHNRLAYSNPKSI